MSRWFYFVFFLCEAARLVFLSESSLLSSPVLVLSAVSFSALFSLESDFVEFPCLESPRFIDA